MTLGRLDLASRLPLSFSAAVTTDIVYTAPSLSTYRGDPWLLPTMIFAQSLLAPRLCSEWATILEMLKRS
jgi:hypothetical protein